MKEAGGGWSIVKRVEGEGEERWVVIGRLCEGKPSLVVDFEDLLDGIDVRGRPKVQTQVVLACCAHDLLEGRNRTCYTAFIAASLNSVVLETAKMDYPPLK